MMISAEYARGRAAARIMRAAVQAGEPRIGVELAGILRGRPSGPMAHVKAHNAQQAK